MCAVSSPPAGPGLPLPSSSPGQPLKEGRRPGSGPAALTCFPGHPLPPCVGQPSLFLFPIATAASAPSAPCPRPVAGSLHSHFLSPALEPWRPGLARGSSPPGRISQSCPSPWAREAAATTAGRPGLPPSSQASTPLVDGLPGRHAPAEGCLLLRPGLGATHTGPLRAPGSLPAPTGEGGAV